MSLTHSNHVEKQLVDLGILHHESSIHSSGAVHFICLNHHLRIDLVDVLIQQLEVFGEGRNVNLLVSGTHLGQRSRYHRKVHGGCGCSKPLNRIPSHWADSSHDPEIDERNAAVWQHEQVPGVHISVEGVAHHHRPKPCVEGSNQSGLGVVPGGHSANCLQVREGAPAQPLHAQHLLRRQLLVHKRSRGHRPQFVAIQIILELLDVACLLEEIHLLHHGGANVAHDGGERGALELGVQKLQDARRHVQKRQIRVQHVRDSRLEHFQHHLLVAALQHRRVHLSNGGAGQRFWVD
mmetsp:Transcript_26331/g.49998  ORF Transcript_26331/g.49998 Transcript_26331/m.49998 type:complete len:293 (-) Transcript_26331:750-1628(-)